MRFGDRYGAYGPSARHIVVIQLGLYDVSHQREILLANVNA